MNISSDLLDEVIAHVREDPENESCGVVAVEAGPSGVGGAEDGAPRAVRVYRAKNIHASPLRFEIAPEELRQLWSACQEVGELGAIYHSHVRSKPYPSQTDINFAANWPGVEWIIVGLADGEPPEVRSYLIDGGEVKEVNIQETA
jgi:[CysO sulfur-carrier protein]-S-L-cysteine hydrolase